MSPRVNRTNRTVLVVLGALVLLAGAAGLAISLGAGNAGGTTLARPQDPVWPEQAGRYLSDNAWVWWVAALVCLLLAFVGLRWLLAQLRTDRLTRMDLTGSPADGLTTLHAGALNDAVADDARAIAGVTGAAAHLSGEPNRHLVVSVDTADTADLATVLRHLSTGVVDRARAAVSDPALPVRIQLRPAARAGRILT